MCGYPANLYWKLTAGEIFVETRVEHVSDGGEAAEGTSDTYYWGTDTVQSEVFISENPLFVSKEGEIISVERQNILLISVFVMKVGNPMASFFRNQLGCWNNLAVHKIKLKTHSVTHNFS